MQQQVTIAYSLAPGSRHPVSLGIYAGAWQIGTAVIAAASTTSQPSEPVSAKPPELDLPEFRLAKVHYNWMYGVGYQQVYAKNTAGNQWVLPLVDVSPGAVYFNWQFQLSSTSLAEVFQALPSSCQQRSERATSRRLCTRYFSMSGA